MFSSFPAGSKYFLRDPESGSGACCDGNDFPNNCRDPCGTQLLYCYNMYKTPSNSSRSDCINIGSTRPLREPTDYSVPPPLDVFSRTIPLGYLFKKAEWPVSCLHD